MFYAVCAAAIALDFGLMIIWVLVISDLLAPAPLRTLSAVFTAIGGGGLAAAAVFNLIVYGVLVRRFFHDSMEKHQERMLKTREDVRADFRAAMKKVRRIAALCRLYSYALIVLIYMLTAGIVGLLCNSGLENNVLSVLVTLDCGLAFLLILPISTLIPPADAQNDTPRADIIPPESAPLLYGLARRAAESVNCRIPFRLARGPGEDETFSVHEQGGAIVSVPPVTLALLSEEELYAILLHEFAHVVHRDTAISRRLNRAKACYDMDDRRCLGKSIFFSYTWSLLDTACDAYFRYASPLAEAEADKSVSAYGDRQAFIDATAKSCMLGDIFRLPCRETDYEPFASETPVADMCERRVAYAEEQLKQAEPRLRAVYLREQPSRSDTHPTLKMRMEAMDIDDFDVSHRMPDGALRNEIDKLISSCSASMLVDWKDEWEQLHKSMYLDRNAAIETFETACAANKTDEYMWTEAIGAYLVLDKERALALADEALSRPDIRTSAAFYRTLILLARDDPAGIDAAFDLLDRDPFIIRSLMDPLADTVFRTGDETLIARIRKIQTDIAQYMKDMLIALAKTKYVPRNYFEATLPPERVAQMRAVFARLKTENIVEAHIVRVQSKFPCVYAIELRYVYPAAENDIKMLRQAMSAIDRYCDSLFLDGEYYDLHACAAETPLLLRARAIGTRLL